MDKKLGNKVAVVTGGTAGIGMGVAKRFAVEGAQVFITGRRQSELDKAVAAIGGNATPIQGDGSNLSDIDQIYKIVKEQTGRIDILFVRAAFYEVGKLGEISEEHFDKTFNSAVLSHSGFMRNWPQHEKTGLLAGLDCEREFV